MSYNNYGTSYGTNYGMSSTPPGQLIIKPICAKLIRNTEISSRMDPFVVVKLGESTMQTKINYEGGMNPQWSDCISFKRTFEDVISFEVWDKDFSSQDDLVGAGEVSLQTVISRGYRLNDWINIHFKGVNAGQLLLDIQFIPDQMQNQMGPKYGTYSSTQPIIQGPTFSQQPIYSTTGGFQQPTYQHSGFQQQPYVQSTGFQQQPMMQPTMQQQPVYQQQPMMQPQFQQQTGYPQQQPYGQQQLPKYF